uniref:Uncharacterized protein n=1 Tax=Arundo donax TaxID=35708 RepID=A0A0A8YU10_ARUDO
MDNQDPSFVLIFILRN